MESTEKYYYWLHWHNYKYEIMKMRERALMRIAWALPRSIVYWCSIRLVCNATQGEHSAQAVPDLTAMDALERWRYDA